MLRSRPDLPGAGNVEIDVDETRIVEQNRRAGPGAVVRECSDLAPADHLELEPECFCVLGLITDEPCLDVAFARVSDRYLPGDEGAELEALVAGIRRPKNLPHAEAGEA